eukprot:TRINITY_DN17787_c0_g1_i1.p1 TRINITY_DN17787_c0_g1~~TRINITY_DN17787_c0_g1_i1.p1  ORF type:complete len:182 (-),score=21.13 TRINITY_DN17787_c0_g1_i1:389-934(-)
MLRLVHHLIELISQHLGICASVALSSTCTTIRDRTTSSESWWSMLLKLVPTHLEIPAAVFHRHIHCPCSSTSKQLVQQLVMRPPEFVCLLKHDPLVPRDRAVAGIQEATSSHTLGALRTALSIGHPLFRKESGEGEVMRGSFTEAAQCTRVLSRYGLEARWECLEYGWSPMNRDQGSCSVQ